jgi:uncharacterized membrane protein
MNVNPLIEAIFKDFVYEGEPIPVNFCFYTGKANAYLTYFMAQNQPTAWADNENQAEEAQITLEIFSRGNFKGLKETVKQMMISGGFLWSFTGAEFYSPDTQYYQTQMTFNIATPL